MNKHDTACLARKKQNPYLCTCGLTDDEIKKFVEKHEKGLDRSQREV